MPRFYLLGGGDSNGPGFKMWCPFTGLLPSKVQEPTLSATEAAFAARSAKEAPHAEETKSHPRPRIVAARERFGLNSWHVGPFASTQDRSRMAKVLLTAFEPYGPYSLNASWLALVELTRDLPAEPKLVTRRYPVDYAGLRERLAEDLDPSIDYAIHLGQAPGSASVRLEAIGLNLRDERSAGGSAPGDLPPLVPEGPAALRTDLPLAAWAARLKGAGIPAQVSWHAGTYLCNAALYVSLHTARQKGLRARSAFVHLPLDVSQSAGEERETPSMPTSVAVRAVRMILDELK
jgi:pyroglutamyl-peptidase